MTVPTPALPAIPQHPAVLAGSEVGRTSNAAWSISPSSSNILVPSTSSGHRKSNLLRRRLFVEVNNESKLKNKYLEFFAGK